MKAPEAIKVCRICQNPQLVTVLDLGQQALTGVFPRPGVHVESGPLALVKCHGTPDCCGLVQLAHTYDLGALYGDNYGYRSGLNRSMVRHLEAKVRSLIERRPLRDGELVLDIGSNDGTTLGFYPSSVKRLGIDPTTEKFRKFHPPGVEAVADFFSAATFKKAVGDRKAAIVTSISMFYDLSAPMEFVKDVAAVLADDGVWHLEQSYLPLMLETNSYDTVCHEHLEFYGLAQIQWMTSRAGLRITDVTVNDVNGGSFAVTVARGSGDAPIVAELLAKEAHLRSLDTWKAFAATVKAHQTELPALLKKLKAEGKRVIGLGASTKGNVTLQYCGLGPDLLEAVAEVNPDKFGCVTPGSLIPIISEDEARARKPDVWLVLPWHFKKPFLEREAAFLAAGGRLLFPLPKLEFVAKP
ncbi:MAG: class I SAM-dependent methyltransferase [Archangium sp.]